MPSPGLRVAELGGWLIAAWAVMAAVILAGLQYAVDHVRLTSIAGTRMGSDQLPRALRDSPTAAGSATPSAAA